MDVNGYESAALLRDFFALQLTFAEVLAKRRGVPLHDAIVFRTNLHRRFGYGNVASQPPATQFVELAHELAATPDPGLRTELVVAAFAQRPVRSTPVGTIRFGCFYCEPPDAEGRVRLHFGNYDASGDVSPLHPSKVARRREELQQLTAYIAKTYPQAQSIVGGSWLYNTKAYCRLFPAEYIASRTTMEAPALHGGSIWGQFINFRGALKPPARDAFLSRLHNNFDPERPWTVFPLLPLRTSAALEAFLGKAA